MRVVDDERAADIERRTSVRTLIARTGHPPRFEVWEASPRDTEQPATRPSRRCASWTRSVARRRTASGRDVMSGWDAIAITGNDGARPSSRQRAGSHRRAKGVQGAHELDSATARRRRRRHTRRTHGGDDEEVHPILPCCVQGQSWSPPSLAAARRSSLPVSTWTPAESEWFTVANGRISARALRRIAALRDCVARRRAPRGCVILCFRVFHMGTNSPTTASLPASSSTCPGSARLNHRRGASRPQAQNGRRHRAPSLGDQRDARLQRSHYSNGERKTKVVSRPIALLRFPMPISTRIETPLAEVASAIYALSSILIISLLFWFHS